MSDDEYYYDPEYDDFQEMLYDADPAPEVADDLAERATYSPIYQELPIEELRDYFSDWEYYSDDYFDDDPTILKRVKEGGPSKGSQQRIQRAQQSTNRGKKRKLSEAQEKPESSSKELEALTACLQGTVYKGGSPEPVVTFQKGSDSPVALQLSNKIMHSAYNRKHGFGKGRHKQDESWANDLSLADMGLKTERSMSLHEQPLLDGDTGDEEEEEVLESDQDTADDQQVVDGDVVETQTVIKVRKRRDVEPVSAPSEASDVQLDDDRKLSSRKRRRIVTRDESMTRVSLPTPDGSVASDRSEPARDIVDEQPQKPVTHSKAEPKNMEKTKKDAVSKNSLEGEVDVGKGRKRKLSLSESATGSTTSSRAKRADTKEMATESKPVAKTAAATRPTRSRKK